MLPPINYLPSANDLSLKFFQLLHGTYKQTMITVNCKKDCNQIRLLQFIAISIKREYDQLSNI